MSITIGPAHNLRSAARSPTTNTMEASINDLTEKLRALETPDRLQTFQEGMDARTWLIQFEILANGKGWTSQKKLAEAMPIYFNQDICADWYVRLPVDVKSNFKRLSEAFESEYSPKPAKRWELENALRARQQRPEEDIRAFVRDVRKQGHRIGLVEDQLVPIILNNLQPNVRALIPGQPTTVSDILDTPVGRGDVRAACTTGIDAKQYQQLMDMLLKQNATIASLEGQVMAASAGHAAGVPPSQHHPRGGSGYSHPTGQRFNGPSAWQRDRGVHRPPQHQGQATGGRDHRQQRYIQPCAGCGGECHGKFNCKAYGTVCSYCDKLNHWANVCRKRLSEQAQQPRFTRQHTNVNNIQF